MGVQKIFKSKPTPKQRVNQSTNLNDPSVKALVMFVVFLCALMTIANFSIGVIAAYFISAKIGGAFFTGSGAAMAVAYKLVKLLIQ